MPCPSCGNTLEAPRLRDLQALPVEETAALRGSGWGFRQGVLAATLLATSALAGAGWWFLVQEPEPPTPFDPTERQAMVESGLDQMAPAQLLGVYYDVYRPMSRQGIPQIESPQNRSINQKIAWCRLYRTGLWTAAGIVLAAGLTTVAIAPPAAED